MKGNISLKQFIQEVKQELVDAQDSSNPFYELHEVQLEVSFALELEGGGKAKFVVIEVGANTTASQLHRVTMKLVPLDVTVEPAGAETIDKVQEAAPGLGDAAGGAATQAEKPTGPGESLCGGGRGGGGGRVRGRFSKRGPLYRQ